MVKNRNLTVHVNKDLSCLTNERVPTRRLIMSRLGTCVLKQNVKIGSICQNVSDDNVMLFSLRS